MAPAPPGSELAALLLYTDTAGDEGSTPSTAMSVEADAVAPERTSLIALIKKRQVGHIEVGPAGRQVGKEMLRLAV